METLTGSAISTPSGVGEAWLTVALALIASLVWGFIMPVQIAAALT